MATGAGKDWYADPCTCIKSVTFSLSSFRCGAFLERMFAYSILLICSAAFRRAADPAEALVRASGASRPSAGWNFLSCTSRLPRWVKSLPHPCEHGSCPNLFSASSGDWWNHGTSCPSQVLAELTSGLLAYERGVALRAASHYALVPWVRRLVIPSLVVDVDDARYGPLGR